MDDQLTHLPLYQPKQPCRVPRHRGGAAALALPHGAPLGMLVLASVTTLPFVPLHLTPAHARTHEAAARDVVVYWVLAVTEGLVEHVYLGRCSGDMGEIWRRYAW